MFSNKSLSALVFTIVIGLSSVAMVNVEKVDLEQQAVESMVVLQGTVLDASTNDELSGVTIEIVELDEETKSNEGGDFYIENLKKNKPYTLTAKKDGYEDFEKTIMSEENPMNDEVDMGWEIEIELEPETSEE